MFPPHCEPCMQGSTYHHYKAWFCEGGSTRLCSNWPYGSDLHRCHQTGSHSNITITYPRRMYVFYAFTISDTDLVAIQIHASLLRRQYFSDVLKALKMKDLQLLRDVDTQWSLTLLMIEQALLLCEVCILGLYFPILSWQFSKAIDKFLEKYKTNFPELQKFILSTAEWDALQVFQKILEVSHCLSPENLFLTTI